MEIAILICKSICIKMFRQHQFLCQKAGGVGWDGLKRMSINMEMAE